MFFKFQFLSTALLSAILISGCGKKKELTGGGAPPTPVPNPESSGGDKSSGSGTPVVPPVSSTPAVPATPGLRSGPAQDQRNQGRHEGTQPPPVLRPAPQNPEVGPRPSQPVVPQPPRQEPNPVLPPPQNVGPQQGRGPDWNPAQHADFETFESQQLTGLRSEKEGLFYTGAGTDELLQYFKKINLLQSEVQKQKNLRRAAELNASIIEIDSESGEVLLTVKMLSGEKYVLAGTPDGAATSMLKMVRSKSNGKLLVGGFHKCVDLDGRCTTSYAKISFSDGAVVRAIYRNSVADYHVVLPATNSGSTEYELWEAFLENGALKNATKKRLEQVELSTFEIVNGRSGVQGRMIGADGNLVAFAGPLLRPEAGTKVSLVMSRLTDSTASNDLMTPTASNQFEYANMLSEIRMLNNNGRGQMRLALKMRKRSINPQDTILVTVARVESPVMNAQEVEEFERQR